MQAPRPFMDGPWRLTMGLRALDPADWLDRSGDAMAQIPLRLALLRDRWDQVVASVPGSLPAQGEACETILRHLEAHGAGALEPVDGGAGPASGDRPEPGGRASGPLARAGARVAEDLCLMEAAGDGYRLTAGVLCFPLHWSLLEKLDRPLDLIHGPVPGFGDRLAGPVDRFFRSLDPARPVWRANWSLVDTPEPFLPPEHRGTADGFDPARPDRTLWLRTERQTLRRLPRTGAVLFTIRTRIEPLGAVLLEPGAAAALAARIREMPEGMARYKGIVRIRPALLPYLDARSIEGGGSTPPGLAATG